MTRARHLGPAPILLLATALALVAIATHHHGLRAGLDDRACPACSSPTRALPAPASGGVGQPLVVDLLGVDVRLVPADPELARRPSSRAPPAAA